MASREFTDESGMLWRVWEVRPETLEQRVAADPHLGIERREDPQRRVKVSDPAMIHGWLAFESRGERRRLAPIPERWQEMSETELRLLLVRAVATGRSRRLIE